MTFRVVFTGGARRDIARLPASVAWAVLAFCEGPLADNPHRAGKPLVGDLLGYHSARRGEYRIVYAIEDEDVVVEVVRVRRRADADA